MRKEVNGEKGHDSFKNQESFTEKDFQVSLSPLKKERYEQLNFLKSRTKVYVPNQEWYAKLDKFAESNERAIVITGESGMGKSALIANWIAKRLEMQNNDEKIIYHFIGASQSLGYSHKIIKRLIDEIRDIYNIPAKKEEATAFEANESGSEDISDKQKKELEELLFSHTESGKLIIILDGIDWLFDTKYASLFYCLPTFPENVKVIYATALGDIIYETFMFHYYRRLNIDALLPENRIQLIKDYLKSFGKSLPLSQEERLGTDKKCENPLVLLSILNELRIFDAHEKIDGQIDYYLAAPDTDSLFALILRRIEELLKVDKSPNNLVKDILSLLAVSHHGLSETEILDISGAAPPFWPQLLSGMAGQLTVINGFVTFSNHIIHNAIKKLYLPDKESEKPYRSRIASYMETRDTASFGRKCDEFIHQLYELEEWDRLYNFLLNYKVFKYMYDKDIFKTRDYMIALWVIDNKCYVPDNFFELDNALNNKNDLLSYYKCVCDLFSDIWYMDFLSLKFALKYMEICEDIYGKNHCDTADAYYYIGNAYSKSNDKEKALEYYEKALTIKKEVLGENHCDTINSYNTIGDYYFDLDDKEKALEYYEKALAIRKEILGKNHLDAVSSYIIIGSCYSRFGDKIKAIEYYKNALAIRKEIVGEDNRQRASSISSIDNLNTLIGDCYSDIGDKEKALEHYKNALVSRETIYGKNYTGNVYNYNLIRDCYSKFGDYEKALEYCKNALAIKEEFYGKNHHDTADYYNEVGVYYSKLGDYEKALEYCKIALEIRESVLDKNHPDTALSCENTGICYSSLGCFEEALKYYENALEIYISLGRETNADNIRQKIENLKKQPKNELTEDEINQLLAAINANIDTDEKSGTSTVTS